MSWSIRGSEVILMVGGQREYVDACRVAKAHEDLTLSRDLVSRVSRKLARARLVVSGLSLDAIRLEITAEFGGQRVPIRGDQGHVVINRVWHELPKEALQTVAALLDGLGVEPGVISLGAYQSLVAAAVAYEPLLLDSVNIDVEKEADRASSRVEPARIVNATLFDYQVKGSAFIRTLAGMDLGVLLADEMGLGKTLQVITLLADQGSSGPSLVVAPASLLPNWLRELAKFAPTLKSSVHAGSLRAGVAGAFLPFDVVITSYETLVNDATFMLDVKWNVVVLDEAQAIKNPDSRRAAVVKLLPRRVGIAVTGTPVENGLGDIWSIVEFVVPQLAALHLPRVLARERDLDEALVTGRAVAPVMLRRKVADVGAQLPERIDEVVALEMGDAERRIYEDLMAGGDSLAALQAARQFCALGDDVRDESAVDESAKLTYLVGEVENLAAAGKKALVFASFTRTIDRLVSRLGAVPGVSLVAPVDGRTTPSNRQLLIDEFGSAPGAAILVMNPRAAGVGLNITAANYVFHFNPEWNPAATDQATARAHRTGQRQTVFVRHLYFINSVEEQAMDRSGQKRQLASGVDAAAEAADGAVKE